MATLQDKEFGEIVLYRSRMATQVRIKVHTNGRLRASLPTLAPTFLVKRLINNSRAEIRLLLEEHSKQTLVYEDGMHIGKSHSLVVRPDTASLNVTRKGNQIIVSLPKDQVLASPRVQAEVRDVVASALRREAKSYLPRRLKFLSDKSGLRYEKVRFSHARGRWGSCSTSGTISLNIALMKLPFELIDYVLIHELSHTEHMNHSKEFWAMVEESDPSYRVHRRALKNYSPHI